MLNYTDINQYTYIESLMVTEILAREVWNFDSFYSLIGYQCCEEGFLSVLPLQKYDGAVLPAIQP